MNDESKCFGWKLQWGKDGWVGRGEENAAKVSALLKTLSSALFSPQNLRK